MSNIVFFIWIFGESKLQIVISDIISFRSVSTRDDANIQITKNSHLMFSQTAAAVISTG